MIFKGLRLSALSASKTGSGYLVNLLSNDVGRLDMGFIFAHYIWILPFQVSMRCAMSELEIFFILLPPLRYSFALLYTVSVDMLFDLATYWLGGCCWCRWSFDQNGSGSDTS